MRQWPILIDVYEIVLQDYHSPMDGTNFLEFRRGDLILLDGEAGETAFGGGGWCFGECLRTAQVIINKIPYFNMKVFV